jgi:hypothetical protein
MNDLILIFICLFCFLIEEFFFVGSMDVVEYESELRVEFVYEYVDFVVYIYRYIYIRVIFCDPPKDVAICV